MNFMFSWVVEQKYDRFTKKHERERECGKVGNVDYGTLIYCWIVTLCSLETEYLDVLEAF